MRRRRLGRFFFDSGALHLAFIPRKNCQGLIRFLLLRINALPPHLCHIAPGAFKRVPFAHRHHTHGFIDIGRIKRRDQAPRDQVKQRGFVPLHPVYIRFLHGGDQCVMIAYSTVIKDPFAHGQFSVLLWDAFYQIPVLCRQIVQRFGDTRQHIHRQIAGVRSRIGDRLMFFIQRLRDLERFRCGKIEQPVRVPLQRR